MITDVTLETQLAWARDNKPKDISLRMDAAETPAEILVQLERGMDWAISRLVASRKHQQKASEDLRTIQIIDMLQGMGIPARHDEEYGGHADISVCLRDGFLWIAEAKNWNGASYIHGGFNQLMTRYISGVGAQVYGAIVIYIEVQDAPGKMKSWLEHLRNNEDFCCDPKLIDGLTFRSEHPHKGSGATIQIRHSGIPLLWAPA